MQYENWFLDLIKPIKNGTELTISGKSYTLIDEIIRSMECSHSFQQKQTEEVFGYKWHKKDTFDSGPSLGRMRKWLYERYGDPKEIISQFSGKPVILDAGCGAGFSGLEYWRPVLSKVRYFGVDISKAIDVAKDRFAKEGVDNAVFMQESIDQLPFSEPIFDIIFSEGVMHHTDSTENAFRHLCTHLKPGGFFMFYIYKQKGPLREFTDDFIREKLQNMPPAQAWEILKPLTELGIKLGELGIEIDVPSDITLLGIPAGKINLQRLFYWNIFKAFYDPNLTFDEMHHINFDWYAPKNAHRHSIEQVRNWCEKNNLLIKREKVELAGITVIAEKQ